MTIITPKLHKLGVKPRILAPFSKRYSDRCELFRLHPIELRAVLPFCVKSDDSKILFVKNSKVGCTTIVSEIYKYSKQERLAEDMPVHAMRENFAQGLEHWRGNYAALVDENIFTFAFVRDPASRFISGFKNIVIDQDNKVTKFILPKLAPYGFTEDLSVSKKIDVVLDCVEASIAETPLFTEQHFRPQVHHLAYGHVKYDFIGRMENFNADLIESFNRAGAHEYAASLGKIEKRNSSKVAKVTLSEQQQTRIRELYKADYEAFGYE